MKIKYFLIAFAALFAVSCSNNEPELPVSDNDDEYVDVVFSIGVESEPLLSRSAGSKQSIGRGANIDMLIYAVYIVESIDDDPEHDGYTLLTQYGQGSIGYNGNPAYTAATAPALETRNHGADGTDHRPGQTIVNVGTLLANDDPNDNKFKTTLRLMRGKEYCLAFWAQSSKVKCYDSEDLKNVIVSYRGADSNDDMRDAFCKAEKFTVSNYNTERDIILTRPFAQINLASTEALFNSSLSAAKFSAAQFTGLADCLNIVTGQTSVSPELASDNFVIFDWAEIVGTKYATTEGGTRVDELLQVDLDGSGIISAEEKFKYLSMNYVLVPNDILSGDGDPYERSSTVIPSVKIFLNSAYDWNNTFVREYELTNVPAHANWRTNILDGYSPSRSASDVTISLTPNFPGVNN